MAQTSTERKLTAKGAQTRELIVAAAARLIFDRGVACTSLEDVRNLAGASNSQLYHYFFRDKSELVQAVVRHQADAVYQADARDLRQLSTLDELRAWRDAVVQSQRRRGGVGGCPLGSLVGELADTDEGAAAAGDRFPTVAGRPRRRAEPVEARGCAASRCRSSSTGCRAVGCAPGGFGPHPGPP